MSNYTKLALPLPSYRQNLKNEHTSQINPFGMLCLHLSQTISLHHQLKCNVINTNCILRVLDSLCISKLYSEVYIIIAFVINHYFICFVQYINYIQHLGCISTDKSTILILRVFGVRIQDINALLSD